MGNLITLTLYTDTIRHILENSEEFCKEVYDSLNNAEASSLGFGSGVAGKIQVTRHSSFPTTYIQMGNTVSEMNIHSRDTEKQMRKNPEFFEELLKYMKQSVGDLEKRFEKTRKGPASKLE